MNGAFTDCQPQYRDLQGYFNIGFTAFQALFDTIRLNPSHTRHLPAACSVIEEIVEGFVEGFLTDWNHSPRRLNLSRLPRPPDYDVQVSVRTTANGIANQTHGHCGHSAGGCNHQDHANSNCMCRRRRVNSFHVSQPP